MWYCCSVYHIWYSWTKWSCWKTKLNSHGYGGKYDEQSSLSEWLWQNYYKPQISFSKVLSKYVCKTLFKLSTGRKPSVAHFIFGVVLLKWGYIIMTREKLTVELWSYFTRYPDRSKGNKFGCPTRDTRIVEFFNTKFLKIQIKIIIFLQKKKRRGLCTTWVVHDILCMYQLL